MLTRALRYASVLVTLCGLYAISSITANAQRQPLASTPFCDEFEAETLDARWSWIDPVGDCSASLASRADALAIGAPVGSTHGLWTGNAPRLQQEITGDFVARTKAVVTALRMRDSTAGILAWQDADNFVGVEVGDVPRMIVTRYEKAGVPRWMDSGIYRFNSAFLELRREGDNFTGSYSLDGATWTPIGTVKLELDDTIEVGLHLTNEGVGAFGIYDFFEINGGPASAGLSAEVKVYPPVTAAGGQFPVKWQIKWGANVGETYVMWDTETHDFHNDYGFRTPTQSGGMGIYQAHIEVPMHADKVYLKSYAVIDGVEVRGEREHVVPTTFALNVGGDQWGLDATRQYWNPDRESDFSPVWYEFWGDDRLEVDRPIAGTEEDWIYQSQRQGMSTFNLWLGPDIYEMDIQVGLHLAELEVTSPGQRVFDVYIERDTPNEVVLRDVDAFSLAGGQDTATAVTTTVHIVTVPGLDEHLTIEFESSSGDTPILNGLVLRGLGAVPQFRLDRRPATGEDDTYTGPAGNFLDAPEVLLGGDGQYHGGFRFPALGIPPQAVIRYANVEVGASADSFMTTTVGIFAHADDSSPAFSYQGTVPSRTRTSASVPWVLRQDDDWLRGRRYWSPEIGPVIQEVVDRPGWKHNNAISLLLVAGPGMMGSPRKVWSYEGSKNDRAWLSLYYSRVEDVPTPTTTPSPTPSPTVTPTATATATTGPRAYLPLIMR